jgi:hypothetical protein
MSDNIVLDMLSVIRGDLAALRTDVTGVKERAGLPKWRTASISRRIDRVGGDVELIKRRLGLVDAP